ASSDRQLRSATRVLLVRAPERLYGTRPKKFSQHYLIRPARRRCSNTSSSACRRIRVPLQRQTRSDMRTTVLAYVIAAVGLLMLIFGAIARPLPISPNTIATSVKATSISALFRTNEPQ